MTSTSFKLTDRQRDQGVLARELTRQLDQANLKAKELAEEVKLVRRTSDLLAGDCKALRAELAQEKVWKIEDPRMLREQVRGADVAYNYLVSESKRTSDGLQQLLQEARNAAYKLADDNRELVGRVIEEQWKADILSRANSLLRSYAVGGLDLFSVKLAPKQAAMIKILKKEIKDLTKGAPSRAVTALSEQLKDKDIIIEGYKKERAKKAKELHEVSNSFRWCYDHLVHFSRVRGDPKGLEAAFGISETVGAVKEFLPGIHSRHEAILKASFKP